MSAKVHFERRGKRERQRDREKKMKKKKMMMKKKMMKKKKKKKKKKKIHGDPPYLIPLEPIQQGHAAGRGSNP